MQAVYILDNWAIAIASGHNGAIWECAHPRSQYKNSELTSGLGEKVEASLVNLNTQQKRAIDIGILKLSPKPLSKLDTIAKIDAWQAQLGAPASFIILNDVNYGL